MEQQAAGNLTPAAIDALPPVVAAALAMPQSAAERPAAGGSRSPAGAEVSRREKSLGVLTLRFVMLFLTGRVRWPGVRLRTRDPGWLTGVRTQCYSAEY